VKEKEVEISEAIPEISQIETPITKPSVEVCPVSPAPSEPPLVECEYCHMATRQPYIVDGHPFCDQSHFKRAEMSGRFNHSKKEPQKPKVYNETPEQKVAVMQPAVSKMDQACLEEMVKRGHKVEFQVRVCLLETIIDMIVDGVPFYLDGNKVHQDKEETDETIRSKLSKKLGRTVYAIPYDRFTNATLEENCDCMEQTIKEA